MFSILRFILIVGVIFYYSPARQTGDADMTIDSLLTREGDGEAPAAPAPVDGPGRLEAMWQALPESAKQAVLERILTTSGLTQPAHAPRDTLETDDLQPAWRGEGQKPRG